MDKRILFDGAIRTIYSDSLSIPERPDTNDAEDKYLMVDKKKENCNIPEEYPMDATSKYVSEKPLTDMLIHGIFISKK